MRSLLNRIFSRSVIAIGAWFACALSVGVVASIVSVSVSGLALFGANTALAQSATNPPAAAVTAPNPAPTVSQGVPTSASVPTSPASAVAQSQDNPYGFKAMIQHGDAVSKTVLAILLILSLGTWYVIATKWLEQSKLLKEAGKVSESGSFWSSDSVSHGAELLDQDGAFRYMADSAVKATQKHGGVLANVDLSTWMESSLNDASDEIEHRLQKGLSFLATVASTSPFIGLFGTVWGILNALTAIGVAGQASIDKVAGPVGEALIMTAIGLAVAVPAAMGYNWLVGRNTNAQHYVNSFAAKLRAAALGAGSKKV